MRVLPLALGFAVLAALAPRAGADPFTDHFDLLIGELVQRDGTIPIPAVTKEQRRQRSALNRCYRALETMSVDVAGDLRLARKMTAALARGFPDDPEIEALTGDMDAGLAGDAVDIRDELEVTIALLAEGKLKTKASARLVQADALWALAEAEPETVPRVRLRLRSHVQVLKGAALAAKAQPGGPSNPSTMTATVDGSPWEANDDYGTGVSGLVQVSDTNGGVRKVLVTGRRILPSTGPPDPPNPPLPGDSSRIQFTIQRVSQDLQAGATYVIGTADGVNATASWYEELEDGSSSSAVAMSGTVTLDTLDLGFGLATVRGTFSLTMYDGVAGVTFDIAGGAFDAVDVPLQNVP